jgi:hypothetical protein
MARPGRDCSLRCGDLSEPNPFDRLPTLIHEDPQQRVPTAMLPGTAEEPAVKTQQWTMLAGDRAYVYYVIVAAIATAFGIQAIVQRWDPNKWMHGDGAFYMNMARGIIEHFSLDQGRMHPHSWYERPMGWNANLDAAWSNVGLGRNGEWWPKHPYLMPVVSVPFILAYGAMGSLIFNFLTYLLIPILALRIAMRFASRPAALVVASFMAATPFFNEQAWTFSNDNFYTVLILFAVDATLDGKPGAAGLIWGFSVMSKATNIFYGPPLVLLLLSKGNWRGAVRFCLFSAGPGVFYGLMNLYMFGSPIKTGYDRVLVVENGHTAMHSHAVDFRWSDWWPATKRLVFGPNGIGQTFPYTMAAIPGLVVMALRKPREAVVFAICLFVPLAFHAPFLWYRMQFSLPQIALAVVPAAAMLPPFSPPAPQATASKRRIRWERLAPAALVGVLLVSGLVRVLLPKEGQLFYQRVPEASVFLGDIPCDYYNNQMERWECSHLDNDWFMTGRVLGTPLTFDGKKRDLVLFAPHPNGPRIIDYPNVKLTNRMRLEYGLADGSRPGCRVQFSALINGQPFHQELITDKGPIHEVVADTAAWSGQSATVRFVTQAEGDANRCIFAFDGQPE